MSVRVDHARDGDQPRCIDYVVGGIPCTRRAHTLDDTVANDDVTLDQTNLRQHRPATPHHQAHDATRLRMPCCKYSMAELRFTTSAYLAWMSNRFTACEDGERS